MFANPLMLVGLSVAVLPIVVHLLSRARFRSVDWGAMMFLDGVGGSQSRSRKFHQWFLLLIRALMVALLAVALARPEIRGKFASTTADGRRGVVVILLDCSASMGFDENGHSRLDLAREAAKQLLSLHRGDRVSLVLMGQPQPPAERLPTGDLWDVGRRIEAAQLTYARADVDRALGEALEAIAPPADSPDRGDRLPATFYVITDRQAANWRNVLDDTNDTPAAWRQRLDRAGVIARVVCIPIGSPESENVLVKSVEQINAPAVVGQPVEFEVKVQNQGPVQWAALPLLVTADRRPIFNQKVNLAPDSTATFRVSIPAGLPDAGTHLITAELNRTPPGVAPPPTTVKPRGLVEDDRLDLVIDVKDPIRVLVVTGDDPADRPNAKDDDAMPAGTHVGQYLAAALAPYKASKKKLADPCVVEAVTAERWAGALVRTPGDKKGETREVRLSAFQAVILAGLEQLTDAQAVAIEQFVYDGGGVLIAPGELSRPTAYDVALFRDGAGILAASLAEATPFDGSMQTTLLGFEATHPILKFLGGRPDALLPVSVGQYFPVDRLGPQAQVLMRYATGEPFLIESVSSSQRRGKLLLMTTSLGEDWSTLPMTSFYLPFVQSAARYLGEGPPRRFNLAPGEPIELPIEDAAEGSVLRVKPPDAPEERASEVTRVGGQTVARFGDTETPGLYVARLIDPGRKTVTLQYTVTAPRDESDLESLTPADWQHLESRLELTRLDPAVTPIAAATALPAPLELWVWLLGAVLILGLLEMKLSRNWSRTDPAEA
ncbi:BatA domain-containing protein [Humisphaera borealis]|uniref:BatA domain-containing protein n=1 Tax=Humisphaera borealis TaxID=2807512 RepID=A0A7M2X468_9BACT|nr:BatA domain-containing protein [Humisphaera borealis]QOV92242.1 BatA domain-containing protein [Humisphaera borealis]